MEGRSVVRFLRTRREATVLAMLVIVFLGLTFASEFFLTGRNLSNVARQISVVGIVALGQALVIIAGGIDLSVGSVIGLAAVTAAMVSAATGMPSLGIVGAIAIGMAVGFLNGVLVTRIRINPFITTLGTLSIARGAALLATNGNPQRFDNWAAWLGYGRIGEVPVQFLLLVALTLVVAFFATRTRWGRNVYAVGDNARAARLAGIDVARTRIMVFTLSGSLAGLGGLLLGGMLTNSNPNLGLGYELDVIAAVILGGVALSGGRGSIGGVVIGAALMGLLRNAFVLLNVSGYWQTITIGLVVILAVGADSLNRRREDD
ncbi:ABC transporter permease [Prosthecomicrobium pneumaticum]|uniref:Autoinducer 2 import system permease protein LsrD n=1 Tax=Prosthecomicrobium pneumaticum TaxID=81895 RepID=A0A7W9CUR1_9HYPH|nr:ABC transporter permease [Prosthecomicrobium pneumaticum]MBB5752288.1 ribose transport system permease protein [Prosthecomicrobium pneumaticum]